MGEKIKGPKHDEVLKATSKNIDTAIISQVAENEKSDLIKKVEAILGYEVDPEWYKEAHDYAKHKLTWQSKLRKTTYDKRYLAVVTAEIYEQNIFKEYVNSISRRRLRA
ncbi:hypothetical protein Amet_2607 [Alkaliphilus metalliredigens QYMF]|uniref:Uncharacterized protein n=1 Tax=Alkaliphilus metalliredigens (strain QYMF) TaxID=293826 RepID=A6TRE1_ALKMQ|nr:hypothetical protein [Alkaliphilus metalliredigens]ABR48759.1 hypothetical protein Amet_2607 [Alkaliphilus metalliredigens QYMF]